MAYNQIQLMTYSRKIHLPYDKMKLIESAHPHVKHVIRTIAESLSDQHHSLFFNWLEKINDQISQGKNSEIRIQRAIGENAILEKQVRDLDRELSKAKRRIAELESLQKSA